MYEQRRRGPVSPRWRRFTDGKWFGAVVDAPQVAPGKIRTHHIAADGLTWHYAPGDKDETPVSR